MHLLQTFQERYGFTRTELTALIVLSAVFLVGSAVKLWMPAGRDDVAKHAFSYAVLDSQFQALSRTPGETTATVARRLTPGKSASIPAPRSIDVNSASSAELQRLPGIGPAIALRIVAYREKHGRFPTVDNLTDVKGIGVRTLERIRPFVVAGPNRKPPAQ